MSPMFSTMESRLVASGIGLRASRVSMAAGQALRGESPRESGLSAASAMANDLRAQAALFGDDVPVDARSAPVAFASLGVGKASDLRAIVRGRNEDLKSLLEALAESLERLASGASDYEAGELRALRDYFADAGDLIVAALGKSPEMGNRDIENSLAW